MTNAILDKLILLAFCSVLYIQNTEDAYLVVPVIIAVTASALGTYFNQQKSKLIIVLLYLLLCAVKPAFSFFIPLLCYDLFLLRWNWFLSFPLLLLLFNLNRMPIIIGLLLFLLIGAAGLMRYRTLSLEKIKREYTLLRDTSKEFSLQLENKNKELMEKQDYEVNLATLNERNRIAREIHDSVGHLLTSSILQIGALMSVCRDPAIKQNLTLLKQTLAQGMDSIRESIHDLHDESIDLYTEISTLLDQFSFCPVSLDYDMEGKPGKKLKYAFISIVKEALSNIAKHSDATFARITLREHPALYQLVIKDNGSPKEISGDDDGIGLKNIADRVSGLNGILNISRERGFNIFISVPKGVK